MCVCARPHVFCKTSILRQVAFSKGCNVRFASCLRSASHFAQSRREHTLTPISKCTVPTTAKSTNITHKNSRRNNIPRNILSPRCYISCGENKSLRVEYYAGIRTCWRGKALRIFRLESSIIAVEHSYLKQHRQTVSRNIKMPHIKCPRSQKRDNMCKSRILSVLSRRNRRIIIQSTPRDLHTPLADIDYAISRRNSICGASRARGCAKVPSRIRVRCVRETSAFGRAGRDSR